MSDLTDFLLARITEDEAIAVDTAAVPMGYSWGTLSWLHGANREHGRRWAPERVLAECEAKRRIIAAYADIQEMYLAMEYLAAVYADHPDYRDEWRP